MPTVRDWQKLGWGLVVCNLILLTLGTGVGGAIILIENCSLGIKAQLGNSV